MFPPAQRDARRRAILVDPPLDDESAIVDRERAMLGGVGREFVEHQRHGDALLGTEPSVLAANRGARARLAIGREDLFHEFAQPEAAPIGIEQQRMRDRQRLESSFERVAEARERVGARQRGRSDRLDDGEDVLHAVRQFGDEQALVLGRQLRRVDVDDCDDPARHPTLRVADRRTDDPDPAVAAVTAPVAILAVGRLAGREHTGERIFVALYPDPVGMSGCAQG